MKKRKPTRNNITQKKAKTAAKTVGKSFGSRLAGRRGVGELRITAEKRSSRNGTKTGWEVKLKKTRSGYGRP